MRQFSQSLQEVFEAYGDDAEAGLTAWQQIDGEAATAYIDAAAAKQYRSDYRTHRRALVTSVAKEAIADARGEVRLFDPGDTDERIELRSILILDGAEYHLAELAGHDGAAVLRKVAQRDRTGAVTTVNRCKAMERLAEHISAETDRLDREVTVGEVMAA